MTDDVSRAALLAVSRLNLFDRIDVLQSVARQFVVENPLVDLLIDLKQRVDLFTVR